jgi:hypothetical protein
VSDALLHALSHCPHLRSVNLTHDYEPAVIHTVTTEGVIALATGCPALGELYLPHHVEVNMDVVHALSRCHPGLRTLQCVFTAELSTRRNEIAELLPKCDLSDLCRFRGEWSY